MCADALGSPNAPEERPQANGTGGSQVGSEAAEGGFVERGLRCLSDSVVFILLRAACIDIEFKDVRSRRVPEVVGPPASHVHNAQAEFLYKIAREDSAATDDKVKQLLTLSSSLATLSLVFGKNVGPRVVLVLFVAALVATVVLCLSVLEVRRGMAPTLEEVAADPEQQSWGTDLHVAYRATRQLHAFRTDRYRAALRYFRLALVFLLVMTAMASDRPHPMVWMRNFIEWAHHASPQSSATPASSIPSGDSTPGTATPVKPPR